MLKKPFILAALCLLFSACAELPVQDEKPADVTPQDIMYEKQQTIQQQQMQQGRPFRTGPGRRF